MKAYAMRRKNGGQTLLSVSTSLDEFIKKIIMLVADEPDFYEEYEVVTFTEDEE